jgi:hypothetical protein
MADHPATEDTTRILAITLGAWAGAIALGAADGVFAQLGSEVDVALAAFAALFALATYALDPGVRCAVDRVPLGLLAVGALVTDAALALAIDGAASLDALARGPLALLGFFGMPLTLVAHAALTRALVAAGFSSMTAKSPASRRAAT